MACIRCLHVSDGALGLLAIVILVPHLIAAKDDDG